MKDRYDYTNEQQEHLRQLRAELKQVNEDIARYNEIIEEAQRLRQLAQSRARRTADQIKSIEQAVERAKLDRVESYRDKV